MKSFLIHLFLFLFLLINADVYSANSGKKDALGLGPDQVCPDGCNTCIGTSYSYPTLEDYLLNSKDGIRTTVCMFNESERITKDITSVTEWGTYFVNKAEVTIEIINNNSGDYTLTFPDYVVFNEGFLFDVKIYSKWGFHSKGNTFERNFKWYSSVGKAYDWDDFPLCLDLDGNTFVGDFYARTTNSENVCQYYIKNNTFTSETSDDYQSITIYDGYDTYFCDNKFETKFTPFLLESGRNVKFDDCPDAPY